MFLEKINFYSIKSSASIREAESAYYLFDYDDKIIRKMIWSLKFRGQKKFSSIFGEFLANNLAEIIQKEFRVSVVEQNFLLIPIPIHKKRRVERGFNQCEWICESLEEKFRENSCVNDSMINLIYRPNYLIRKKYTKKQSWKNARDRESGLKNVFVVSEKFRRQVHGQKIILVDDVVTTGSTIREARRTLLESGASLVIVITVAH